MKLSPNRFKQALADRRRQIGLWCTLSSAFATEVVADSGFDWLLLDTEHSPGDVLSVMSQLQALSGHEVSAVVRPASNDTVLIKRYLDIGVQSLLIPYVEDADDAARAVAAVRYPPAGVRGVSALTRATRFGRVEGYAQHAHEQICLIVQVETRRALDNIEAIAAVDGVDGVFVGPGDLAASLGHIGNLSHPDVETAVADAIRRITEAGKPAGILTGNPAQARAYIEQGTIFTAVGVDAGILARATESLSREFAEG